MSKYKVFIGVGHGGTDPGAVANGFKEKDLNLAIALACQAELIKYGVTVQMSRTKDENDKLADVIKECNAFNPNIAIDIHNNAGGGDGAEVYYGHKSTAGKLLGQAVLAEVVKIGQNSRGTKTKVSNGKDYFGFIRDIKAPAIIMECAFVDNKKDIQIIDTAAEQKAMGIAIAKGILKHLKIDTMPTSKPSTTQMTSSKTSAMTVKNLNAGKFYAIPQNEIEYIDYFYGTNGNESIKSAYSRVTKIRGCAPDFFFNAELFNFKTREPASSVVCDGVVHLLTETHGIAFPNNNRAVFCYKNNVRAKDYVGAYPVLVRNGKAESTIPSGTDGSRGRTAIGVNDNTLFIALVPDGNNDITLYGLRTVFINNGADNAINLDGGGSTQYYAPNGNHYTGRNVRGFIGVWLKDGAKTAPVTTTTANKDVRTVKVNSKLRIRKTPSLLGLVVGSLSNGVKVEVLEEKGEWCRIAQGWVSATYLKK